MKPSPVLSIIISVLCCNLISIGAAFAQTAKKAKASAVVDTTAPAAGTEKVSDGMPTAAGNQTGETAELGAEGAEVPPPAEDASPCAQVSCSDHGTCVERDGAPYCACDPNFAPDAATGLNCLAVAPVPPPAPAPPVVPPEVLKEQEEMNAAVDSVATVISPRAAQHYYWRYKSHVRASQFDGTYHQFLQRAFTSQRNTGIIFLSVGAAFAGGAAAFFVTGVNNIYRDPDLGTGLVALGIVSAAAADVFLIMGAVKTGVGASRLSKLRTLSDPQLNPPREAVSFRVSPILTRTSQDHRTATTYGLSAQLTF